MFSHVDGKRKSTEDFSMFFKRTLPQIWIMIPFSLLHYFIVSLLVFKTILVIGAKRASSVSVSRVASWGSCQAHEWGGRVFQRSLLGHWLWWLISLGWDLSNGHRFGTGDEQGHSRFFLHSTVSAGSLPLASGVSVYVCVRARLLANVHYIRWSVHISNHLWVLYSEHIPVSFDVLAIYWLL